MAEYLVEVTLPGTMEHFSKAASGRLTIGRSDDCDIALHYPTISRPHAEIESMTAGEFVVRDLNSRNGTIVNGSLIRGSEVVVNGRTTLQIGPYMLALLPGGDPDETLTATKHRADAPRLKLDRGLRALTFGDAVVIERLSPLEYRFLDYLDSNAPNVVENSNLGDRLWGAGQWDVYMLHNLVRRFRRKLEEKEIDPEAHLVTVPGVGYRLA